MKGKKLVRRRGRSRRKKMRRRVKRKHQPFESAPPLTGDERDISNEILRVIKSKGMKVALSPGTASIQQALRAERVKHDSFSSIFLVNITTVIRKYHLWASCFPSVRPYYAVKANPDPAIITALNVLGCGFDCASKNEIILAQKQGVASKDIIFANPCKHSAHVKYAQQVQVRTMTFDNEFELRKMLEMYPGCHMVIRILPYDLSNTYSVMPFGRKFGAPYEDCVELLALAKELGANVTGVSFHVGSMCYDVTAWVEALKSARRVFDAAAHQGFALSLLDIGGGFPGPVEEGQMGLRDISAVIQPLLNDMFAGVQVIAEPGRFFSTECCTLACVVTSKRAVKVQVEEAPAETHDNNTPLEVDDEEDEGQEGSDEAQPRVTFDAAAGDAGSSRAPREERKSQLGRSVSAPDLMPLEQMTPVAVRREWMYYLSDGVYGCFNNKIFDHAQPVPFLLYASDDDTKSDELETFPSILFGPTCDSIDVVHESIELPELEIGSWLYFPCMGAYTIAAASSFNGFDPPARHYIMEV